MATRKYPKAGDHIQIKEGEDRHSAEMLGRGGKASSKLNYDYFNLRKKDEQLGGVHLDKTEWRFNNAAKNQLGGVQKEEKDVEEASIALIPVKEHGREECVEAKQKELKAFEDFEVYTEVEDQGQERLSSRGFEETVEVQADSPTGCKETLHMLLCIAASKGWKIKSGDVKNAYLQGEKLDREVFMEPPIEKRKANAIWKLQKSVYGMNDTGRQWFFKVEETLRWIQAGSMLAYCLTKKGANPEPLLEVLRTGKLPILDNQAETPLYRLPRGPASPWASQVIPVLFILNPAFIDLGTTGYPGDL